MKRPLQWSHLTSGLPIPTVFHQLTYNILGKQLRAQQSADVRIMLDGEIFTTSIYNIGFNRAKFSHSDILQFKYDNNKALLAKIKEQLSGMDHPFDKPTTRATLIITIRDVLWQDLPESYSEESINYYRDTIYNYVSQRYGGVA